MLKKIFLLFLSFITGFGLFLWVTRVVGWKEIGDAFLVFAGWEGLIILGLTLMTILVGIWKWREILKEEEVNLSFQSLVNPYLAGFSVMFLAPILIWGGEIFRAYIIRERNSVPWSKGMASVTIDRILEWTVNLFVIILGGIFFLAAVGFPSLKLSFIFGGVFLVLFGSLSFFYFKCIKKESIASLFVKSRKILKMEDEVFSFFKKRKEAMWKSLMLSFLKAAIMYVRAWFLILFLGKSLGAMPALSVLGFSYLATIIPLPAALGSHEAIQAFVFNSLGLDVPAAAAFTVILRGAELLVALFGVIILFRLGIIILKEAIFKKIDNLVEK